MNPLNVHRGMKLIKIILNRMPGDIKDFDNTKMEESIITNNTVKNLTKDIRKMMRT